MALYDALIVLGGGIERVVRSSGESRWRLCPYLVEKELTGVRNSPRANPDDERYVVLGGHARIVAASILIREGITCNVVLSTGKPRYLSVDPEAPSEAVVMLDELLRRIHYRKPVSFGLTFFPEDRSKNTKENAQETLRLARRNQWGHVGILTSEYHLMRAACFFRQVRDELRFHSLSLTFIAAERVLMTQRHYPRIITRVERSSAFSTRREWELRGLLALQNGAYRSLQNE